MLQSQRVPSRRGVKTFWFLAGPVLIVAPAFSQENSPNIEFEVAAITPVQNYRPGAPESGVKWSESKSQIYYSNVTLYDVIARAYGVQGFPISAPGWTHSSRWNIVAKLPENGRTQDIPLMLQALLKQRFMLLVHREHKEAHGFALVVAKHGPKLQETATAAGLVSSPAEDAQLHATGAASMAQLAEFLKMELGGVPIADMTSLEGIFIIDLTWSPRETFGGARKGGPSSGTSKNEAALPSISGPSMYVAIEKELGLKLEERDVPFDALIVDRLEKSASN
jgi:uncharacterized protein (TIGR03435 family)